VLKVKGFKSSVIDSLVYTNKVLAVGLKTGRKYVYTNVPKKVVDQFIVAESKGEFFNSKIKGKYEACEV